MPRTRDAQPRRDELVPHVDMPPKTRSAAASDELTASELKKTKATKDAPAAAPAAAASASAAPSAAPAAAKPATPTPPKPAAPAMSPAKLLLGVAALLAANYALTELMDDSGLSVVVVRGALPAAPADPTAERPESSISSCLLYTSPSPRD